MSKTHFVDFKAIKAALTMEQVLQHYGLLDRFKRSGDSLSGPCPIHKGSNPTQFRVSVSKNIWNCFSECKHGGNVLDFIAKIENITIHAAALKAIEWFQLDPDTVSANQSEDPRIDTAKSSPTSPPKITTKKSAPSVEKSGPNKPLNFRLDKLDRQHPYLATRGISQETIIDFGIGYCAKGIMAERIAIPIHNTKGEVVAYAGRLASEHIGDADKYRFPPGFRKSLELFNCDRAFKEPPDKPLVIVEGFFDCMALHQHGYRKVVAVMGSTMSAAQEELIRKHTDYRGQIIVMLDEDEAGRSGRDDVAVRLSKFAFVKVHSFEKENWQPDQLNEEEIMRITDCL